MRNFLLKKAWPFFAGLLAAFIIMMICEYINSYFFPLPAGLDLMNPDAVAAFTASLPWTAYILVWVGWALGSFKGGCVATYLSGEEHYRVSLAVGVVLLILGVINNMLIGHGMFFNIIGLPTLIAGTYIGHIYMKKVRNQRESKSI